MSADPLKDTPLMSLEVVNVAALPVVFWLKVGKVFPTPVRSLFVKASALAKVAKVPVVPGRVIVAPATAAAFNMLEPEVEPARRSLPTAPPGVPKVLAPVTV
jgi:hypothetical protein